MKIRFILFLLFAVFLFINKVDAQEINQHEIESSIQDLDNFHEVIYPIWHTAYPEKDYNSLRSFLPQVNELAEKIYTAKLPGILRDKGPKWIEGIKVFKFSVDEFNKAVNDTNNQALLTAAENLHTNYELLVRTVRPVTKEVDEFHKLLYVVYHKHLPESNYLAIKELSKEMIIKAEAIKNGKLSKRVESKKEAFFTAADELITETKTLENISSENFKVLVEKVHTKYANIEKIFD